MRHNWEYKTIDDCFHYIKNGANIKQDKLAEGLPITRIETLSNGVFNRDRLGYANIFDKAKYIDYIMEDKDILMSHINSKQYIGRTVLYNKCGDECIIHGMNLLRLKASQDIVIPKYATIYFQCVKFKSDVAKIRKDAVNQSSMAISDLKKIPIPVPPLPTQQSIVSELDTLSGIIAKCKETLKDYDALEQSIFYDMFGDPVKNDMGWEVKKWQNIFDTRLGKMLDKSKQSDSDQRYPYLANFNVQWRHFDLTDLRMMPFSESELSKYDLQEGDLIICEGGESGRCAIWHDLGYTVLFQKAVHRARLKTTSDANIVFISFLMQILRLRGGLKDYISKSTIEHLTGEKLNILPVPLPPLPLQQTFASKIEAIERMKAKTKEALKEAETLFEARMDYWFG